MTHDLGDKFAVLTDDHPEPLDPAALVRGSITRRVRRRRATAGVLTTASVAVLALTAAPVAGALLRTDTPAAGGTPQPITLSPRLPTNPEPLPRDPAFVVAKGKVGRTGWEVTSMPGGCLALRAPGEPNLKPIYTIDSTFARRGECGNHVGLFKFAGGYVHARDPIVVYGGVTAGGVRKVRVTVATKTYLVDTAKTPASKDKRFFALALPGNPAAWSFRPAR